MNQLKILKKRIQSKADSSLYHEEQPDSIVIQDILYVDRIKN